MNIKKLTLAIACTLSSMAAFSQKALFIPNEWKFFNSRDTLLYSEVDTENKYTWSKTRSKESENFICYWDKYYKVEPTKLASSDYYRVDIDDLLKKAEQFYALNVGKLSFCDEATSKVSKYKMMILVNHTTTWTCYGGGYDFTIGALWLNPATCKPVGHSVAHEVGHSFQYMCYSDHGGHSGFHDAIGNGSTFWEQTAQWQANQSYPELKFDQSWGIFPLVTNYAMTNECMRYQSYWWHYYLAEKYGIDIIGKIWRHPMSKASDANEVFMDMMQYKVNDLYKEYFDYAMKMATLDLNVCRKEADNYIGTYTYNSVSLGGTKHQVAYSSCPQSTGFNVIPLKVPAAGTTISTEFTSLKKTSLLATGDPAVYLNEETKYVKSTSKYYNSTSNMTADEYKSRGFRLGYVALLNDGTRIYSSEDSIYCQSTANTKNVPCTTSFTVPENTKKLYMVVSPAPSKYFQHKWDENIYTDDQWPYTVEFTNTNISGAPVIQEGRPIADATITIDVNLPKSSSEYKSVPVKIDGDAAGALGTAFQMSASDVSTNLVNWSSAGPTDGKMMFYALNSLGKITNSGSSANGYGHWFSSAGTRCDYGNSAYVFSEFNPANMTFSVGQYPNKLTLNKTYKIAQALRYKKDGKEALVKFIFNVTCVPSSAPGSYNVVSIQETPYANGDVDGDGQLTITDITTLINIYLNSSYSEAGDLDLDGETSITDITALIDKYLQLNE